ncbi:D-2-hydroxyacid dehydrogenase [Natronobiforma cellulositropha]|uniref:D-2-hydroxyacid dehydrogenase n=1 Tax=Natronobiforma cellulositropha TaxID=1679076 RepID=UPI0021D5772D|nr:D-2-hydroxyacid dehydrogenase [Natronobiforma cellulositropha]
MLSRRLSRLGVHESVDAVFPAERLEQALADDPADLDVAVVGDDGIGDCDAVVTLEYREAFCDLAWVHSIQAGVDRFPLERLAEAGVVLTNSTGIHGRTVGETVAGYLLAFSRRLHDHAANQCAREWDQPAWDEAFTLPGTAACVVGTGTLGRGVADVLGALGVEVIGVRRSGEAVPGFEDVHPNEALLEAVGGVEFVIATVPLTAETEGLFDAAVFAAMDAESYFVNVARGGVVDEPALVEALESGAIAGAALDVFETEPLPADSPLWDAENVIVTPHCAAFTRDYYRDIAGLVTDNLERAAAGEALENRVV